jgi:hypothetical protein
MPAVGLPVMLRMLSAPEPRDVRPSACTVVSKSTASSAAISRICKLARVVTST